jgi:hypothetical protein
MRNAWLAFSLLTLLSAVVSGFSCGSSSNQQLQSVTVEPATADAENYPSGTVPFEATGSYIDPDQKVTPLTATWTACSGNNPTSDVVVNQSGSARCASGAQGAFTIYATAMKPGKVACPAINPCGVVVGGCVVNGTAQLTCP